MEKLFEVMTALIKILIKNYSESDEKIILSLLLDKLIELKHETNKLKDNIDSLDRDIELSNTRRNEKNYWWRWRSSQQKRREL